MVIVDTLEGFGRPGEVMVIENALNAEDRPEANGHVARLTYLSSLRELAAEFDLPEVLLVAVEPPFDDFDLDMLAEMSLGLAQERKGNA